MPAPTTVTNQSEVVESTDLFNTPSVIETGLNTSFRPTVKAIAAKEQVTAASDQKSSQSMVQKFAQASVEFAVMSQRTSAAVITGAPIAYLLQVSGGNALGFSCVFGAIAGVAAVLDTRTPKA